MKSLYNEIDEAEIAWISDGCGKKGGLLDVPDFVFTSSCDEHDVDYWEGGTKDDRKRADKRFLSNMMMDSDLCELSYWYKIVAWVYYLSVRLFAKSYFYYGKQRTYKDLQEAIKNA